MEAIEFKEQTVIVAKDQKEYKPLPAYIGSGIMVCCWMLNKAEVEKTIAKGHAKIRVMNFNGPVQAMEIRTVKPDQPFDFRIAMNCNPESYDLDTQTAVLHFDFGEDELLKLREDQLFWMIVAIRDSPLLPINPSIEWE